VGAGRWVGEWLGEWLVSWCGWYVRVKVCV